MGEHHINSQQQDMISAPNWSTLHASMQSKDKLSGLIFTQRSSLLSVRLHHFPIIRSPLCPHFLSHSWPAKSPMTLCCCAAVLFWENLGQLGWDAVSWVSVAVVRLEKKKSINLSTSPALSMDEVDQPPRGRNASFGVSWRKCSSARGAEWAVSIQSTFQKAAEAVILAGCHRD